MNAISAAKEPAPPITVESKPDSEPTQRINSATKLLAASFYTRGLWRPVFAWLSLSSSPFQMQPVNWGVQNEVVRAELHRAFVAAMVWTTAQLAIIVASTMFAGPWWTPLLVFSVLLQWFVYPYFAVRAAFKRMENSAPPKADPEASHRLVLRASESPLPDVGYLLREANFSVDTSKKSETWASAGNAAATDTPLSVETFYKDIEQTFAGRVASVRTIRVATAGANAVQPRVREWRQWANAEKVGGIFPAEKALPRLLIVGEDAQADGMAVAEFVARMIGPHISIRMRMRWLPGYRGSVRNLAFLSRQRFWWRGIVLPLVLAALVYFGWTSLNSFVGSETSLRQSTVTTAAPGELSPTEPASADTSPNQTVRFGNSDGTPDGHVAGAAAAAPNQSSTDANEVSQRMSSDGSVDRLTQNAPPIGDIPSNGNSEEPKSRTGVLGNLIQFLSQLLSQLGSPFSALFFLATTIVFLPIVLLFIAMIGRGVLLVRGLMYASAGSHFFVGAGSCLRYKQTGWGVNDEDSLQNALAHLQIIEQVVTNRIVDVLQTHGIDSGPIKEEMKVFVNEGIYMTGGALNAANVLVGARGVLNLGKRRATRSGKRAMLGRRTS